MKLKFWSVIALLCNITAPVFSQELPDITTDRPDQTETPYLVVPGHLQLENGVSYEQPVRGVRNLVLPTTLWRFAVNKNFELRAITELNNFRAEGSKSVVGLLPVQAGVKIHLAETDGWIPQTSLIAHLAFPDAASPEFKAENIAPNFRFTMQHDLSDKLTLSYNLGMEWNGFDAAGAGIYTLTSGYSLTDKLGMYLELFGFLPEDNKSIHNFDGGFTYLVRRNVLVDISAGKGLTDNAIDYYVSLGFSFRLPD
jgi:hypothetical protein